MPELMVRLLIGLMLVLNGTGFTTTATQMSIAHLATQPHGERDARPCHDATSREEVAPAIRAHAHEDCTTTAAAGDPGCCQSSHCNCDCLQHAAAAIAILAVPAGLPPERHPARPRQVDRAPPLLSHLLRPPIG